ncbi:hypothetical protein SYN60AY4M2_13265 [Synechococcus sp. 60AY4M2]|nr:hypothetical protein SYN65AY6A5_02905 [Synechococcus sp. 65AY6A5]PIK96552.1 hypothetical protein SYN60AY4M2_13265 [Synechococcus sp. 60AY4M2]PIK99150.1 hypothetical protein SYN63AY4M1_10570 [Synechococcus sp. 63AY4M1]PIL02401.1 hypothetical protein SYN65AY640_03450 [Synechococcus sp. 65AY640]
MRILGSRILILLKSKLAKTTRWKIEVWKRASTLKNIDFSLDLTQS